MQISNSNKYILLTTAVILIVVSFLVLSPNSDPSETGHDIKKQATELREGKLLSEKYCAGCHLYPEPDLLPKEIWSSSVLPAMGPKMGIFRHGFESYPTETDPHLPEGYYPSEPLLSNGEWGKIIDYYEEAAPEKLTRLSEQDAISTTPLFFDAKQPLYDPAYPPKITAIRIDTLNEFIYSGDANEKKLLVFNRQLDLVTKVTLPAPISDIRLVENHGNPEQIELLITSMGNLLPTDAPTGSVKMVSYNPALNKINADSTIRENLARPVESKAVDLNRDGLVDILISEFGHRSGSLFWLENTENGLKDEPHILINTPGCIETKITDINGNGLQDVIALCTQANQAIYLFENQGEGSFSRKTLVQFHIASGSSSFELHDFNNDGHLDILYTSGDNADYSTIFKPYHGVYIYLNDGQNNFTKKWFYPVNGAFDAHASDFDRDGDLDIAAISFYADYTRSPEEGFVYFKNEGDMDFKAYHHPAASAGRWITMDVADWTGDGYEDIILGNFSDSFFSIADSIQNRWQESSPFLLLENTQRTTGQ